VAPKVASWLLMVRFFHSDVPAVVSVASPEHHEGSSASILPLLRQQKVATQMHADKPGCTAMTWRARMAGGSDVSQRRFSARSACILLICVHLRFPLLALPRTTQVAGTAKECQVHVRRRHDAVLRQIALLARGGWSGRFPRVVPRLNAPAMASSTRRLCTPHGLAGARCGYGPVRRLPAGYRSSQGLHGAGG